jgi:hypothetical protein
VPGAADDARAFLKDHPATLERFARVSKLVEGFESSFGMELLATVHWVMKQEGARGAAPSTPSTHGTSASRCSLTSRSSSPRSD